MTDPDPASGDEVLEATLASVLARSHHIEPSDVPKLIRDAAVAVGALDAEMYLADLTQRHLVPVPAHGVPTEPLPIDGSVAGGAFQTASRHLEGTERGSQLVWVPLLDGADRMGVVRFEVAGLDEALDQALSSLAALAALLVISKQQHGDLFPLTARHGQAPGVTGEIQAQLLPPLTTSTSRVGIAGVVQTSPVESGDAFDYAINDDVVDLAIVDAMGHDVHAGLASTVAIAAFRHARRAGHDLVAMHATIDTALAETFGTDRFVTAQLARLDLDRGTLRWINAGHPQPILLRGTELVPLALPDPNRPLGLVQMPDDVRVIELDLVPGDRLLFYTDGVVDARSPERERFGEARLGELLAQASCDVVPLSEVMRRVSLSVLDHHPLGLRDDATMVLLEWRQHTEEPTPA